MNPDDESDAGAYTTDAANREWQHDEERQPS
jgi:hypothetical protein